MEAREKARVSFRHKAMKVVMLKEGEAVPGAAAAAPAAAAAAVSANTHTHTQTLTHTPHGDAEECGAVDEGEGREEGGGEDY